MKTSENGRTYVVVVLIMAVLLVVSGLVFRYQRDLARYSVGPRAVMHKITRRPAGMIRLPRCHPVPAHFILIGSLKGRRIVQKVVPTYPLEAEEIGVSTQVRLNFRVYEDGNVAPNIWVTRMGQPEFDAAAIQALRQWRFSPKRRLAVGQSQQSILNVDNQGEPGSINFTFTLPPPICT